MDSEFSMAFSSAENCAHWHMLALRYQQEKLEQKALMCDPLLKPYQKVALSVLHNLLCEAQCNQLEETEALVRLIGDAAGLKWPKVQQCLSELEQMGRVRRETIWGPPRVSKRAHTRISLCDAEGQLYMVVQDSLQLFCPYCRGEIHITVSCRDCGRVYQQDIG